MLQQKNVSFLHLIDIKIIKKKLMLDNIPKQNFMCFIFYPLNVLKLYSLKQERKLALCILV